MICLCVVAFFLGVDQFVHVCCFSFHISHVWSLLAFGVSAGGALTLKRAR